MEKIWISHVKRCQNNIWDLWRTCDHLCFSHISWVKLAPFHNFRNKLWKTWAFTCEANIKSVIFHIKSIYRTKWVLAKMDFRALLNKNMNKVSTSSLKCSQSRTADYFPCCRLAVAQGAEKGKTSAVYSVALEKNIYVSFYSRKAKWFPLSKLMHLNKCLVFYLLLRIRGVLEGVCSICGFCDSLPPVNYGGPLYFYQLWPFYYK